MDLRLHMALDREQEQRMRSVKEPGVFGRSRGIASNNPEYLTYARPDPADQGARGFDLETKSKTRIIT